MSNLKHTTDKGDASHVFDYGCVRIKLTEVDGNDIGSEGGIRFRMFFKKDVDGALETNQVDEFVIYPDAIDWENGGKMKPEFQKRIEKLQRDAQEERGVIAPVTPPREEPPVEPSEKPKEESAEEVDMTEHPYAG